jgi:hypothetical protein
MSANKITVIPLGQIILGLIGLAVAWFFYRRHRRDLPLANWEPVEGEISLGGLGKVKIRPNDDVRQLAHRAWAELATRKAGLPIDPENDIIVEVYNSWYQIFAEFRDLAKQVPATRVASDPDTKELLRLIVDALNLGLRPHLTTWQGRFRRWYDEQLKKRPLDSPQAIQKDFPEYPELLNSLLIINQELITYTAYMKRLAHGETPPAPNHAN